jgi:hypothetical protein
MSLFPQTLTVRRTTRAPDGKGGFTRTSNTVILQGPNGGTVQPATSSNGGQYVLSMEPGRRDKGVVVIYTKSELVYPQEERPNLSPDTIVWKGSLWEVVHFEPHTNILIAHNKYIAEYRGKAA